MTHFDFLQQSINAAKPVKIVAIRAKREYRRLMIEEKNRELQSLAYFERRYGVKNEPN